MSSPPPSSRRATIADLQSARDGNTPFAVLTAYDRATAEIAEAAGVRNAVHLAAHFIEPAFVVLDLLPQYTIFHGVNFRRVHYRFL